ASIASMWPWNCASRLMVGRPASGFFMVIALRAMEAPLRENVTNCGEEPSVVLNNVKQGTGSYGYNAATGEYGDMIAMDF
ncbi:MAG: hypothetical protein ABI588_06955, partial [Arenimonas sp.]